MSQPSVSVDTTIDDRIRVIPARYTIPYKKPTSSLAVLVAVVAVLFVVTVGTATWYYTAPLREKSAQRGGAPESTPVSDQMAINTTQSESPSAPPEQSPSPDPVTQPPTDAAAIPPAALSFGQDTDGDGLTDREEILIGTQVLNPDSDGDGYIDGSEVANLFSPLSAGGKTLSDEKSLFGVVTMQTPSITFLAPLGWRVEQQSSGLILRVSETESIAVTATSNVFGVSVRDWIKTQSGKKDLSFSDYETKNGITGVRADNGSEFVFLIGGTVLGIEYRIAEGAPAVLSYPHLMKVIADTIKT